MCIHGIIVYSIPAREKYTRKNRKVSPPPPQKHTKMTHTNTKHSEHQHGSRTLGAQHVHMNTCTCIYMYICTLYAECIQTSVHVLYTCCDVMCTCLCTCTFACICHHVHCTCSYVHGHPLLCKYRASSIIAMYTCIYMFMQVFMEHIPTVYYSSCYPSVQCTAVLGLQCKL